MPPSPVTGHVQSPVPGPVRGVPPSPVTGLVQSPVPGGAGYPLVLSLALSKVLSQVLPGGGPQSGQGIFPGQDRRASGGLSCSALQALTACPGRL